MDKYVYKVLKYIINHPNSNFDEICIALKISHQDLFDIQNIIKNNGLANIYFNNTYKVDLKGQLYVKNYYKNKFLSFFKTYIFEIIKLLISFGLGLLTGIIIE